MGVLIPFFDFWKTALKITIEFMAVFSIDINHSIHHSQIQFVAQKDVEYIIEFENLSLGFTAALAKDEMEARQNNPHWTISKSSCLRDNAYSVICKIFRLHNSPFFNVTRAKSMEKAE